MITVRDLCHEYSARRVLDGISFCIPDGEYVGLVGHNGSGKSTLLRLLEGLIDLQQGGIEIDGLEPGRPAHRTAVRQKVGLLFQNPDNQIVATIVEDDVAFGPENLGLSTEEIQRRVDRALSRVRLDGLRFQSPANLSGGQKQRLAVASLLALEPAHLLLDEPLSMLDPAGREEVLDLLEELHREHRFTVVHATHDLEELVRADRILALQGGRLVADMKADEFFRREDLLTSLELERSPAMLMARELVAKGIARVPKSFDLEGLLEAIG